MEKHYAIVDIETTGGRAVRDKITEIAIVLHDGQKIVDKFETLLNPETTIPYGITELTGITQEMVAGAPKFYEVAKKIVEMTEGAIFVAHNVRFDYTFLREEFKRLGYTFSCKQLCTVRLARKAFPGLPSYSLSNLIRHFDIKIENRHRAMGDVLATVELFETILELENSGENVNELINLGIKESLLPKNLSMEKLHALPEECGVYYFHDETGAVAYVGKSINIKKRVAQHFSKKTVKAAKLQQYVHDITFEITGSELIALLLESHEIKKLRPHINRAQRMQQFPYLIHSFKNEQGYLCLEVEKPNARKRRTLNVVAEYPKVRSAREHLKSARDTFDLCARHCHLEKGTGPCFDYHLKRCQGACIGVEPPDEYNLRAEQAIEMLSILLDQNFFLIDKGRSEEERGVVLVEGGEYRGFGYANLEEMNGNLETLKDVIRSFESNPDTKRIVRRFFMDNSKVKVIRF